MGWNDPIDIYCERLSDAFWAEPANALSNGAFLIAALFAWLLYRKSGFRNTDTTLLILLAGLVGIGSFLFHTFATVLASFADIIPIWTFVALFVLSAMHRIGGMAWDRVARVAGIIAIIAVAAIYFASNEGVGDTAGPDPLNGSGQYLPAVIALIVFSSIAWKRQNPMAIWFSAATVIFIGSLTFRTIDMMVCDIWPLGTHFIWHALNGLMIWILLNGFIKFQANRTC